MPTPYPVVHGFDPSFLTLLGSKGTIAAFEISIQILEVSFPFS